MTNPASTSAAKDLVDYARQAERTLAAEQVRSYAFEAERDVALARVVQLEGILASVTDQLGTARRELALLHKLPIDLDRVARSRVVRAGVRAGRLAQRATGRQ